MPVEFEQIPGFGGHPEMSRLYFKIKEIPYDFDGIFH
jgi:hypothetical protein